MSGWGAWDRVAPGRALGGADPEIAGLIVEETRRQSDGLELIASENFVSPAVLEAMGSQSEVVYEALPQDDPTIRQPDITRARAILGWEPTIGLADGLARTLRAAGTGAGARA